MKNNLPYHQLLLEHYHAPRNRGVLPAAQAVSKQSNPACGDSIVLYATAADGKITAIMFEGAGCIISQAIASLVTEKVCGMPLADLQQISAASYMQGWGITLGPTRLRCATLTFDALQDLVRQLSC